MKKVIALSIFLLSLTQCHIDFNELQPGNLNYSVRTIKQHFSSHYPDAKKLVPENSIPFEALTSLCDLYLSESIPQDTVDRVKGWNGLVHFDARANRLYLKNGDFRPGNMFHTMLLISELQANSLEKNRINYLESYDNSEELIARYFAFSISQTRTDLEVEEQKFKIFVEAINLYFGGEFEKYNYDTEHLRKTFLLKTENELTLLENFKKIADIYFQNEEIASDLEKVCTKRGMDCYLFKKENLKFVALNPVQADWQLN